MKLSELLCMRDKRVIVTGGAQGIGKCVALMLAQEGVQIGIFDRNIELAAAAAAEIARSGGSPCRAYACDVTDPAQVQSAMEAFIADFGTLDGVFNNAGICVHKGALDVSPAEWQKVIDVNLSGVFYVAQAAARQFVREGKPGSIVNTASMSGSIVNIPQEQASYNASKAAVVHLTKSLAVEWASRNIRVNSISPGYIFTDMTTSVRGDWVQFWTELIPFQRMGKPEELAGAVLYLLSDASSYTSGCDMIIDGCFTCI